MAASDTPLLSLEQSLKRGRLTAPPVIGNDCGADQTIIRDPGHHGINGLTSDALPSEYFLSIVVALISRQPCFFSDGVHARSGVGGYNFEIRMIADSIEVEQ